jgi:hypothetical protein
MNWQNETGGVKEGMDLLRDIVGLSIVSLAGFIEGVTVIIQAFQLWQQGSYLVGLSLGMLFRSIGDWFGGIGTWFKDRFNEVIQSIKNSNPGIYNATIKPFVDALAFISGIVDQIKAKFEEAKNPGRNKNDFGGGGTTSYGSGSAGSGGGSAGAYEQFAGGVENFKGGWAKVGEKGPEMVNLPRGSDVYTASETKAMIRGMNSRMPAQSNFAQPGKYPSASSGGGSAAPVIINNYITLEPAKVELDGREIGESAGRYIAREMVVQR